MIGFETYDETGRLTFSTRDSTYLVVHTKKIDGVYNSASHRVSIMNFPLPEEFTNAKVTIYPMTILHPSTGAIMPYLSYNVLADITRLTVKVKIVQEAGRIYPDCLLVILGN